MAKRTLRTPLCDMLGIDDPILSAGMANSARVIAANALSMLILVIAEFGQQYIRAIGSFAAASAAPPIRLAAVPPARSA